MSDRQTRPMQYVLDLLTDGILVSAKQQIGFTPPDLAEVGELPFVMAYIADGQGIARETAGLTQGHGDLTFTVTVIHFSLEHIDTRTGLPGFAFVPTPDIRRVLDEIAHRLSIDHTMRGLVRHAFVSGSTVFTVDSTAPQEAQFVVTCELLEDNREDEWIDQITFTDPARFGTISSTFSFEQSTIMPKAIGCQRNSGINAILRSDAVLNSIDFSDAFPVPDFAEDVLDFSVSNYVRVLLYQDQQAAAASVNVELRIGARNSGNQLNNYRRYLATRSWHGWREMIFRLDSPFSTVGSPPNLRDTKAIELISANFGQPATTTFGMIWARLGYYQSDVGANLGLGSQGGL